MVKVAEAIEYAHQRGVIHRDLKPANILLDRAGNPRVTDFGLAKKLEGDSGLTGSGQIMGTPSYMPPEQAGGKRGEVGPAADVYALGATLYALVTGRPPFQAATAMDTRAPGHQRRAGAAAAAQCVGAARPGDDLPEVPGEGTGQAVCRRRRPWRDDLRRYLAGEPILARPVGSGGARLAVVPAQSRGGKSGGRDRGGPGAGHGLWRLTSRCWPTAMRTKHGPISGSRTRRQCGPTKQARHANQEAEKAIQAAHRADQARKAESDQRRLAEEYLYPGHIALANHELSVGNVDRVAELLNQCPERLRRWEWYYLRRQIGANLLTFRGHVAPVRALVLMPDGRRAASADEAGTVLIWDVNDGHIWARCVGHEGAILTLALRPDGQVLASAGQDATIRLWDPATGRLLRQLRGHRAGVPTLAFSADGKRLASGGWDGLVKVWDADSGQDLRTLSGSRGWVTCVAFAPQGHYLVASSWKRPPVSPKGTADTHVWETDSGRTLLDQERPISGLPVAYFEAGGKPLRDAEAGRDVGYLVVRAPTLHVVAVSRDQRRAEAMGVWNFPGGPAIPVSGLPGEINLTTSAGPAPIRLAGHTEWISALVFDPSGRRLVSSSFDSTVRVWDAVPSSGVRTVL